ncbi:cis-prenyltransferase [Thecaphora frezii]
MVAATIPASPPSMPPSDLKRDAKQAAAVAAPPPVKAQTLPPSATAASDLSTSSPSPLRRAVTSPLSLLSLLPIPSLQSLLLYTLSLGPIPRHIAFVMDGNRRWATSSGSTIRHGHVTGFHALRRVLEVCMDLDGLDTVTVYAFAIDNFKRNPQEVDALMDIAKTSLVELLGHGEVVARHQVRVKVIGRKELLPEDVRAAVDKIEQSTRLHTKATLNICMPYASRDEMAGAIRSCVDAKLRRVEKRWRHATAAAAATHAPADAAAAQAQAQVRTAKQSANASVAPLAPPAPAPTPPSDADMLLGQVDFSITPYALSSSMQLSHSPPLDILVRTSGVSRLSDFMLWQCNERTQLHFVDKYWPQFGLVDMVPIILDWQRSQIANQVQAWCGWHA